MINDDVKTKGSSDAEGGASTVQRLVIFERALQLIAAQEGMTLLNEFDGELSKQHQIGANKAFDQCANIAKNALEKI